jgi:hypothetical protein
MGEQEAILMAAADAVRAWRRTDAVTREALEADSPELHDALATLDDVCPVRYSPQGWKPTVPAAVAVRIADVENRYANVVVLPLDGTVIGLAIRLPENAVMPASGMTFGLWGVSLRLQASAVR